MSTAAAPSAERTIRFAVAASSCDPPAMCGCSTQPRRGAFPRASALRASSPERPPGGTVPVGVRGGGPGVAAARRWGRSCRGHRHDWPNSPADHPLLGHRPRVGGDRAEDQPGREADDEDHEEQRGAAARNNNRTAKVARNYATSSRSYTRSPRPPTTAHKPRSEPPPPSRIDDARSLLILNRPAATPADRDALATAFVVPTWLSWRSSRRRSSRPRPLQAAWRNGERASSRCVSPRTSRSSPVVSGDGTNVGPWQPVGGASGGGVCAATQSRHRADRFG